MAISTTIAAGLSSLCFLWSGVRCFVSRAMRDEFMRCRMPQSRLLTGTLQVAGALGLLVGWRYRPLLPHSACGLAALMAVGVLVHVRIRDSVRETMPAAALLGLNLFIVACA